MNQPIKNQWHPFAILCIIFMLLIVYSQLTSFAGQFIFLLTMPLLMFSLGAAPKNIFSQIRVFLWMLPFTFFMHIFLASEGSAFFRLLFMEGVFQPALLADAFGFTLRIFVFIYIMGGLFAIIRLQRLLDALAEVLLPLGKLGVPVNSLFQILNIGLRFFPVLKHESVRLQEVRQSLGVGREATLRGRIQTQLNNLVPIFINTMHRAETVAQMMSLRGYDTAQRRTLFASVSWRFRDSALLTGCLLTFVVLLLI